MLAALPEKGAAVRKARAEAGESAAEPERSGGDITAKWAAMDGTVAENIRKREAADAMHTKRAAALQPAELQGNVRHSGLNPRAVIRNYESVKCP